jgi:hypothetical protein
MEIHKEVVKTKQQIADEYGFCIKTPVGIKRRIKLNWVDKG